MVSILRKAPRLSNGVFPIQLKSLSFRTNGLGMMVTQMEDEGITHKHSTPNGSGLTTCVLLKIPSFRMYFWLVGSFHRVPSHNFQARRMSYTCNLHGATMK